MKARTKEGCWAFRQGRRPACRPRPVGRAGPVKPRIRPTSGRAATPNRPTSGRAAHRRPERLPPKAGHRKPQDRPHAGRSRRTQEKGGRRTGHNKGPAAPAGGRDASDGRHKRSGRRGRGCGKRQGPRPADKACSGRGGLSFWAAGVAERRTGPKARNETALRNDRRPAR